MENAVQLIKDAKEIVIFGGKNSKGDVFACVSVLTDFLKNIGKKSRGVILNNDFKIPDFFSKEGVAYSLAEIMPYVLTIDKKNLEISEIAFNESEQKYFLELYLRRGSLSNLSQDIEISQKDFRPDLIITVGVTDRADIIEINPEHSQVFFDTPIINIDNRVENTKYGQVNLVYLTRSSKSEIVFELLKTIDELSLTPAQTTSLLGGIILETKNLTSTKTNPATFESVARLIERGADYKLVIEKLYQTKSFLVLKLTGFLLSKITIIQDLLICFSSITKEDAQQNDFHLKDLPQALEEIENNFFLGFLVAAFWEKEDGTTTVIITWRDRERLIKISKAIEGGVLKQNFLVFNMENGLKESTDKIINLLKKEI